MDQAKAPLYKLVSLSRKKVLIFKDKMFCYHQITNQPDLWQSEIFGTIIADNQVKRNLTTLL